MIKITQTLNQSRGFFFLFLEYVAAIKSQQIKYIKNFKFAYNLEDDRNVITLKMTG